MKIHSIKSVELGPRQLSFGFDTRESDVQDLVMTHLIHGIETRGQVWLEPFVVQLSDSLGSAEQEILQAIFWLAHELEIQFRVAGQTILPHQAKKRLLDDPQADIRLITPKTVEDCLFQQVQQRWGNIFKFPRGDMDQHGFAFALLQALKEWQTRLRSFKTLAQRPHFPGAHHIEALQLFLKTLLIKQDAYSLIHACFTHGERITAMAEEIEALTQFYTQDMEFWDQLIHALADFQVNLPELAKIPEAAEAHERLTHIVASASPYALVPEARSLVFLLKEHHDAIEKRKLEAYRKEARSKIEAIMEKLEDLFHEHHTDQDLRNRSLLGLRGSIKQLDYLNDQGEMARLLLDIQDLFDDFEGEIKDPEGDAKIILEDFFNRGA